MCVGVNGQVQRLFAEHVDPTLLARAGQVRDCLGTDNKVDFILFARAHQVQGLLAVGEARVHVLLVFVCGWGAEVG